MNWKRYLKTAIISLVLLTYFTSCSIALNLVEGTDIVDSIYWSFTLNTPLSSLRNIYKDSSFVPKTSLGKLIVSLYILLGFPIVGFTLETVAEYVFEKEEKLLRSRMDKRFSTKIGLIVWKFLTMFLIFFLCFTLETIAYYYGEEWKFIDCLYYAVSSSLVGESSLFPTKPWTKTVATISVTSTSILFVFMIASIAEFIAEYYKQSLGNKYLKYKLTRSTLEEMDQNKNRQVSKLEFLEYILVKCEMVDELIIERIHKRFKKLDYTKNSYLTLEDIRPEGDPMEKDEDDIPESCCEKYFDPLDLL